MSTNTKSTSDSPIQVHGDGSVFLDGEDVSGLTVTMADVLAAGHCVSGTRDWFKGYQMDFRHFVKNGVPVEDFLATQDAHAVLIVKRKIERLTNG